MITRTVTAKVTVAEALVEMRTIPPAPAMSATVYVQREREGKLTLEVFSAENGDMLFWVEFEE